MQAVRAVLRAVSFKPWVLTGIVAAFSAGTANADRWDESAYLEGHSNVWQSEASDDSSKTQPPTERTLAHRLTIAVESLEAAVSSMPEDNGASIERARSLTPELDTLEALHLLYELQLVDVGEQIGNRNTHRWSDYSQRYRERISALIAKYSAFKADSNSETKAQVLLDAVQTLIEQRQPLSRPVLGNQTLPYAAPAHAAPALDTSDIEVSYEGTEAEPQPADIESGTAVPFSPAILQQAEDLGHDPIRILNFVRQNIDTAWYFGVMKGAEHTLRSGAGNDADQAALLVALLRASHIPARIVRGVIEVPVEELTGILELNDSSDIPDFLSQAGIPAEVVIRGGRADAYRLDHVWVSAYIPYSNYRGALVDDSGAAWLPLDTSFKRQNDITGEPVFSQAELSAETLFETYLDRAVGSDEPLDTTAQTGVLTQLESSADTALADNGREEGYGAILSQSMAEVDVQPLDFIPSSLPFSVHSTSFESAKVPQDWLHTLSITIHNDEAGLSTPVLERQIPLIEAYNERITFSYMPDSLDDQELVQQYGGLGNVPAYLVQVRPQLKIAGLLHTAASDGLALGEPHLLTVELASPGQTRRIDKQLLSGNYHAMAISHDQTRLDYDEEDSNQDTEPKAARILSQAGYRYLQDWESSESELAQAMGQTLLRPMPSVIFVSGTARVDRVLDQTEGVNIEGIQMDAQYRPVQTFAHHDQASPKADWRLLAGAHGSFLEHQLFQSDLGLASLSTVKGFQKARQAGIELLQLTQANYNNYATELAEEHSDAVLTHVDYWVQQGYIVTLPATEIRHNLWQGSVWSVHHPETGASGYYISGALAGGMSSVIPFSSEALTQLKAAYVGTPSQDPSSAVTLMPITYTDHQEMGVGQSSNPFQVKVFNLAAEHVIGAEVLFTITGGGGTFPDGSLRKTVETNENGIAETSIIAGTDTRIDPAYLQTNANGLQRVSRQLVTARLISGGNTHSSHTFSAAAKPAAFDQLSVVNRLVGPVAPKTTAGYLLVNTLDEYGNPVYGIDVTVSNDLSGTVSREPCVSAPVTVCGSTQTTVTTSASEPAARFQLYGAQYPVDGDQVDHTITVSSGNVKGTTVFSTLFPSDAITLNGMTEQNVGRAGQNLNALRVGIPGAFEAVKHSVAFSTDTQQYYSPLTVATEAVTGPLALAGYRLDSVGNVRTRYEGNVELGANDLSHQYSMVFHDNDEEVSPGWDDNSDANDLTLSETTLSVVYGLDIDSELTAETIVLDTEYRPLDPVSLRYRILPETYNADQVHVEVYSAPVDGGDLELEARFEGTGTQGQGYATMPDLVFDSDHRYFYRVVVNTGNPYQVNGDFEPLPIKPVSLQGMPTNPVLPQYCDTEYRFNFTVMHPGTAKISVWDRSSETSITEYQSAFEPGIGEIFFEPPQGSHARQQYDIRIEYALSNTDITESFTIPVTVDRRKPPSPSVSHMMVNNVDLLDGSLTLTETDLDLGGRGSGLQFKRTYSSNRHYRGDSGAHVLGKGWSHNYDSRAVVTPCGVFVNGILHRPKEIASSTFVAQDGYHSTVIGHGDHLSFYSKDGTLYEYEPLAQLTGQSSPLQPFPPRPVVDSRMPLEPGEYQLVAIEDTNGNRTTLEYSSHRGSGTAVSVRPGRLEKVTGSNGRTLTFHYDNAQDLLNTNAAEGVDACGIDIPYGRAESYEVLSRVEYDDSRYVEFSYDALGRLTQARRYGESNGRGTSSTRQYGYEIEYDTCDQGKGGDFLNLVFPEDDAIPASEKYLRHHLIDRVTDERGFDTTYTYDFRTYLRNADARQVEFDQPFVKQVTQPGDRTTDYDYDDRSQNQSGYLTRVTRPRGTTEDYYLTYMGQATQVEKPSGTVKYTWSADHLRMTSRTDERNTVTQFEYDEFGNRTSEKVGNEPARTTTYIPLGAIGADDVPRIKNRVHVRTDREGFKQIHDYDDAGNLLAVEYETPTTIGSGPDLGCGGCEERFTYADNGDRVSHTNRNGHTTYYQYDEYGFPKKTIHPDKTSVTTRYNSQGWLTERTDEKDHTTVFGYDGLGRKLSIRHPDGEQRRFTYDAAGNKLTEQDENNHTTTWTYTAEGWVDTIIRPTGDTTFHDYDKHGNLTSKIDWNGHETTHDYDERDYREQTNFPLGRVIQYDHDEVGNVIRETHPEERVIERDYDIYGRVEEERVSLSSGEWAVTQTEYDDNGNVIKTIDPEGAVVEQVYNFLGKPVLKTEYVTLTAGESPQEATTLYEYDNQGNRTLETNPLGDTRRTRYNPRNQPRLKANYEGVETVFEYDNAGNLERQIDAEGYITHFEYDNRNRRVEHRDAEGRSTVFEYDGVGNRTAVLLPNGNRIETEYDELNRPTRVEDREGLVERREYDGNGNVELETGGENHVTKHTYDALNRKEHTFQPDGVTIIFEYDLNNNLVSRTDGNNETWIYGYNLAGHQTSETRPDGVTLIYKTDKNGQRTAATDGLDQTTTWQYNERGQVLLETDALDQTLATEYDLIGQVVTQTDKRGIATEYVYDKNGNRLVEARNGLVIQKNEYDYRDRLLFRTDAKGETTGFEYDLVDRRTAVVRPDNSRTQTEYRDGAREVLRIDGEGNRTLEILDFRDRVIARIEGHGSKVAARTDFEYDNNGNRTVQERPGDERWEYQYDTMGRLDQVEDPDRGVTEFDYDGNGNHTGTTDALNKTTAYGYDEVNRRTRITYPDGATHSFVWDDGDNLDYAYDPNGIRVDYDYDELNREKSRVYSLDGDTQTVSLDYDPNNNLTLASVDEGQGSEPWSAHYYYDNFDRLETYTDVHGFVHGFRYDLNGNRTGYTFDDDETVYRYDAVNRLTKVIHQGLVSQYGYYNNGRLKAVTHPNGSRTDYRYTPRGQVERIDHSYNGSPLTSVTYEYDANGNRLDQWETNGRGEEHTEYTYDDLDRLATVTYPDIPMGEGTTVTYTYDAVGNRKRETHYNRSIEANTRELDYQYNDRHQLTAVTDALTPGDGVTYGYDETGNQTRKTETEGDTTTVTLYRYDLRHRMVEVKQDGTPIQTARYDHNGLRIESDSQEGGLKRYSYDGETPVATHTAQGDLIQRYFYGPIGRDRLFDADRGSQYYHPDALGSPLAITEGGGQVVARYAYTAFGEYRRKEVTNTRNPFGFTGHEYDEATDLLYAKQRYLDPETARFLSQDPFEGNLDTPPSLHKYLYAYQNPTVYVDPDGRFPVLEQVADWLHQRSTDNTNALRDIQRQHGSSMGTRSIAAVSGIGATLFDVAGSAVDVVDVAADGLGGGVSKGLNAAGIEGPQFLQESARKTGERGRAVYEFGQNTAAYVTQDDLSGALSRDLGRAGEGIANYANDVFVEGNLDATANFSGGMFEAALGGALTRSAKLAGSKPKIVAEDSSSPNPDFSINGEEDFYNDVSGAGNVPNSSTGGLAQSSGSTSVRPLNPSTRFYVSPDGEVLDARTYARNSGFRKGVRDDVWGAAVDSETGLVSDPLSGAAMNADEPWDMGHRPGMEYWKERDNAINKWLYDREFMTRKEFLDRMNDPDRYRPELPESNRSHRGEDESNDFWE